MTRLPNLLDRAPSASPGIAYVPAILGLLAFAVVTASPPARAHAPSPSPTTPTASPTATALPSATPTPTPTPTTAPAPTATGDSTVRVKTAWKYTPPPPVRKSRQAASGSAQPVAPPVPDRELKPADFEVKLGDTIVVEVLNLATLEAQANTAGKKIIFYIDECRELESEIHLLAGGTPLSDPLNSSATSTLKPLPDPGIIDQIVELALAEYRLGRTSADEPFAVPLHGPNIAHMLRGGADPLRKTLTRRARRSFGRSLSSSAINDALNVIDAEAADREPEEVALRIASYSQTLNPEPRTLNSEGICIDLGRSDGRTVIVTAAGWNILDRSPVLFRRTSLTGELPLPVSGGRLDMLRALINVDDEAWPILRGWLIAALFPSIAHPILLLGGQQGTGKSTALRMLSSLVDPSAVPLRSEPHDAEHWCMMAHGSWCVAIDNVSTIPQWFSDALCKAVTGDGFVRRRLYTDGDLAVLEFRRVIGLTSVEPGILAGDLADRLLFVELDPIDDAARLPETNLLEKFDELKPQLFGALLDEVAAVLRRLPKVKLARLPRMADFARILAALPRKSDVAAAVPSRPNVGNAVPSVPSGVPCATGLASALKIEEQEQESDNAAGTAAGTALLGRPSPTLALTSSSNSISSSLDDLPPPPWTIPDASNAIQDDQDDQDDLPLAIYLSQNKRLASEIMEGDPLAVAVTELMQSRQTWQGTATELLSTLTRPEVTHGWPKVPQALTGRLKRLAPALRTIGIAVSYQRGNDYARTRQIHLTATPTK